MRAEAEVYKGIQFVRLSSLPKEHKKMILNSTYTKNIIKILHNDELLADCLPYAYYVEWHQNCYGTHADTTPSPQLGSLKFVFK